MRERHKVLMDLLAITVFLLIVFGLLIVGGMLDCQTIMNHVC